MSTTLAKVSTRLSNAEKHPGIPDQKKKWFLPAEMAAARAAEKVLKDTKAAAELATPSIIADVEDRMAMADKDYDKNAAQPVPTEITQVVCPICRTRVFANLEQDDNDEVHKGQP